MTLSCTPGMATMSKWRCPSRVVGRTLVRLPVARMGSATTASNLSGRSALGISAFVSAVTAGGFRVGLLMMIAVSAGAFACILALPAQSLHKAHEVDAME